MEFAGFVELGEFKIPNFEVPFPSRYNSRLDEGRARMWDWLDRMDLVSTPESRVMVSRTKPEVFGALGWPDADIETLTLGMNFIALVFRFDDQVTETRISGQPDQCRKVVEEALEIIYGKRTSGTTPGHMALADLMASVLEQDPPSSWLEVFQRDLGMWFRCLQWETEFVAARSHPALDEFYEQRILSVGMPWLFHFNELATGRYLSSCVRDSHSLSVMRGMVSLHAALVNDIYSTPRDLVLGVACNPVLIIQGETGCTTEEAVDQVHDKISSCLNRFLRMRNNELDFELDLLAVRSSDREAALSYADTMSTILQGNIEWHRSVERYAIDDVVDGEPTIGYPDDLIR